MSHPDYPPAPPRTPEPGTFLPPHPPHNPGLAPGYQGQGHGYAGGSNAPAPKPSRKLLWVGLGAGFAAGVLATVMAAAIGAAIESASTPSIEAAVEGCGIGQHHAGIELGDNGTSVTVDTKGEEDTTGAQLSEAKCILDALAVPDRVVAQMDVTTAMQGRQNATWGQIEASWTYHPDDGMNLIVGYLEK